LGGCDEGGRPCFLTLLWRPLLALHAFGVTVLSRLGGQGLLEKYPKLLAYIARAEARPAYQRAERGRMKVRSLLQARIAALFFEAACQCCDITHRHHELRMDGLGAVSLPQKSI